MSNIFVLLSQDTNVRHNDKKKSDKLGDLAIDGGIILHVYLINTI